MLKFMAHSKPEDLSAEFYNIDDVEFSMQDGRRRNEVVLTAKSKSNFNLFRYYLALRAYVDQIEAELHILKKADGNH